MTAEERIAELGIDLNQPSPPIANYVSAVQVGNLLFVSGHGPRRPNSSEMVTGKVGADLTVEEGYEAARLVGVQILASIKREIGSVDKVKRCVKALGMVNCTPDFVASGMAAIAPAMSRPLAHAAREAPTSASKPLLASMFQ